MTAGGQAAVAPRFGGFGLDVSVSDGSSLNFVGQNYRNDLSLQLDPSFSVGKRYLAASPTWSKLALFARFSVSQTLFGTDPSSFGAEVGGGPLAPCSNLTPSAQGGTIDPAAVERCDPATGDRRTDYSDVWLGASLPRFATIPRVNVAVSGSTRFVLPVSAQSRFQTLRLGVTATGMLSRAFWSDRFRLAYGLWFSKNFHAFTTPGLDPESLAAGETGRNPYSGLSGVGISNFYADPSRVGSGEVNTSYSFANVLSVAVKLPGKWFADAMYMWRDGFAYGVPCRVNMGGSEVDTCRTGDAVAARSGSELDRPGHRKSQLFWATVGYNVRDWVNVSLAWITAAPRLKPDSTFRQGLVSLDYNAFTSVVLSTTITVEELADRWRKGRTN